MAPGADIDHRGTRFTPHLFNALRRALRDPTSRRVQFGAARFEDARFPGPARFGETQFSGEARFDRAHFSGNAGFDKAQFSGPARFDKAQFSGPARFADVQFSGDVWFDEAQFAGSEARFDRAHFSGNAWFKDVQFPADARFDRAHFSGNAGFDKAQFSGDAWFREAQFSGDAWFREAQFSGDAWFRGAGFSGDAWFSEARFSGSARFEARFSNTAAFDRVQFSGDTRFDRAQFNRDTWFSLAQFEADVRFVDARFDGITQFAAAQFSADARFNSAQFSAGAWFIEVKFNGYARFSEARFSDSSEFGAGTTFGLAQFSGFAAFEGADFTGNIGFNQVQFSADVRFSGVNFSGMASFNDTQFSRNAEFDTAQFSGLAVFDRTQFSGAARFGGARFSGDARFSQARFSALSSFGPVVCAGVVDLSGAVFETPVTLEIAARTVRCDRTRWESTATMRLRYATVDLGDAVLYFPVAVTAHPGAFTTPAWTGVQAVDESLLADSEDKVRLVSVRGVDAAHLVLADTDLSDCLFFGAFHLDQLRLAGKCTFASTPTGLHRRHSVWPYRWTRRRTLAEEHHWRALTADPPATPGAEERSPRDWRAGQQHPNRPQTRDPGDVAALYRQLRKAYEDGKDEPGAADFYYGECEMRRHDRIGTPPGERGLLWGYWLLSGYGLRASRALGWLLAAVVATMLLMMGLGVPDSSPRQVATGTVPAGGGRVTLAVDKQDPQLTLPVGDRFTEKRFDKALQVVLNSVVFRSSGQDLTTWGTYTEMASRFTEPVLLALAILAMRSRIKR
ncbi:pentapeptide repeat-containing protein [Streptomyces sp. MB09-02B]|uniref:pentapeptide repeat-containing protein n=1 Tax=Streptomyces sp. MB09-02B TaxID=3028667 RepID=UPI0029BBC370|nr:pentapeptide repeat-containing protein [Streptomyces sp. MB09-02B]MDX3643481.1 pentapeptide repeat-containing protein [Streptomyces sp. MB09-02B]